MFRRKKDQTDSYIETRHSGGGILATVLGVVSLLMFVVLLGICMVRQGKGEAWVGSFGFTAFVIAFCGMVYGLNSFHERCKSYVFCKIGTLLCGFMVAVLFLVFCTGLAA